MVTKRDDNRRRPTDRVNIEQSASGRWTGRVLQLLMELRQVIDGIGNECVQVKAGGTRPEVLDFSLGNITKPKVKICAE